jgi:hypothetical protein
MRRGFFMHPGLLCRGNEGDSQVLLRKIDMQSVEYLVKMLYQRGFDLATFFIDFALRKR